MPALPGFLLRHTVVIEPYLGQGGNGASYGPAVTVRCFRDDARRQVLNDRGEQVISEGVCYCPPGTTAPPMSRLSGLPNGKVTYVISSKLRDGGGLPTPDHVEVTFA